MGFSSIFKGLLGPSGIPVYIEDDGTILGYVVGKEGDENNRIYKVKSDNGTIEIPADSVIITKKALIYKPPWANEIEDFIKKLEDEKSVNPDVELALSGNAVEDERIKGIISKGREYRKLIQERYKGFKDMREKNLREMQYMMQKRMANAIDKGEYVESMNELRKKIKILELNIKEAEKLLAKLDYPALSPTKVENVTPVAVPIPAPGVSVGNTEQITTQPLVEKKRVKKLRVLKVEADLIAMQTRTNNKAITSPEDITLEIEKIDGELKEIDKILSKSLSPDVKDYFEKRRDELLKRKEKLGIKETKKMPPPETEENKKEEIELLPEKEKGENVEDLDKLISQITEEK